LKPERLVNLSLSLCSVWSWKVWSPSGGVKKLSKFAASPLANKEILKYKSQTETGSHVFGFYSVPQDYVVVLILKN